MSFIGDIVNSIGSNKAPPSQPKPPSRPSCANASRPISTPKPAPRPTTHQPSSSLSGIKRKVEDVSESSNGKASKTNPKSSAGNEVRRPPAPPLNAPKPLDKSTALPKIETSKNPSLLPQNPSPTQGIPSPGGPKPPPSRGSYADLMARAKQSAEQRPQAQVGVIKHQTTVKDKPSKLAERRREEQEKTKSNKSEHGKGIKPDQRRSVSPKKKASDQRDSKTTVSKPKPSYKGTMGISTSRGKPYQDAHAKKSKYDEYLGTDEEDGSDPEDEAGYDGFGSEGSSDMEAGFDDMEGEEMAALRTAKQDDAKELALESELRKQKEERRKRLVQLAAKKR